MANRPQLNLMCPHLPTPCPDGPNCPYQHNEALLYPLGMPCGYVRKICSLSVLRTTCPHSYCWDIHVDDPLLPARRRVGTGVFIPRPRYTLMGPVGPPRAPPPPPAPVVRPLLPRLPARRRVGTGVFIPRPRYTLMGPVGPPRAPPPPPSPVVRHLLPGLDGDGAEVEWNPFPNYLRAHFQAFIDDCRRGIPPQ